MKSVASSAPAKKGPGRFPDGAAVLRAYAASLRADRQGLALTLARLHKKKPLDLPWLAALARDRTIWGERTDRMRRLVAGIEAFIHGKTAAAIQKADHDRTVAVLQASRWGSHKAAPQRAARTS